MIERIRGKRLVVWGTALLWNRPPVLSVSWHPGPDENTAQTLDTYFRSVDGDTRIDLAHDGRERLGDVGVERRDGYHKIARYAETLAPMYCTR